jgi:hypothetical protein
MQGDDEDESDLQRVEALEWLRTARLFEDVVVHANLLMRKLTTGVFFTVQCYDSYVQCGDQSLTVTSGIPLQKC